MTIRLHQPGLAAIKLVKGMLLLFVGLGMLKLMHAESATLFSRLIEALPMNTDSRIIHTLVLKVDVVQPQSALVAMMVSLGHAGLLLLEGFGLWLEHNLGRVSDDDLDESAASV